MAVAWNGTARGTSRNELLKKLKVHSALGMPLEHRAPNNIVKKGKKKIRYRSTGNNAQITVVGCVNAVGNAIPLMIIYAAKTFNADWCKSDVPGTSYALSPKG